MRLLRLFRTSSFRLTLLYAAVLGGSVLLLGGIAAWSVTGFMAEQIDATTASELAEVQADAGGQSTDALRQVIVGLTERSPGIFYLLQSADGQVLAGNMLPLAPKPGPRALAWTHQPPEHHMPGGIRGRGLVLPDGAYLFVGVSDSQLGEVREVIVRTGLLGLAAAAVLALAGGAAMSYSVLRRVEAISRASRAIMAGDLRQRMALRGTDDEFDHLSASLNGMLDRIQDLMLGLQQVSSDIAHDLRTPLTRLRQSSGAGSATRAQRRRTAQGAGRSDPQCRLNPGHLRCFAADSADRVRHAPLRVHFGSTQRVAGRADRGVPAGCRGEAAEYARAGHAGLARAW